MIVFIIYCLGTIGSKFFPNYFQIWTAMKYVPFFYIGGYIRKSKNCVIYRVPTVIYLIVHVTMFLLWIYLTDKGTKALIILCNLLLCMIEAIGAFVIFQRMAEKIDIKNPVLQFGSKHSMTIYLFHQQIIYVLILMFNGKMSPSCLVILNFSISIAISSIIAVITTRYSILRFLTTGR